MTSHGKGFDYTASKWLWFIRLKEAASLPHFSENQTMHLAITLNTKINNSTSILIIYQDHNTEFNDSYLRYVTKNRQNKLTIIELIMLMICAIGRNPSKNPVQGIVINFWVIVSQNMKQLYGGFSSKISLKTSCLTCSWTARWKTGLRDVKTLVMFSQIPGLGYHSWKLLLNAAWMTRVTGADRSHKERHIHRTLLRAPRTGVI